MHGDDKLGGAELAPLLRIRQVPDANKNVVGNLGTIEDLLRRGT